MVSTTFLSVFLDEVVGLLELFKLSQQSDSLVEHVVFNIVAGGLFELSLQGKNFGSKPNFVKISHLMHLLGSFTEINK